MKKLHNFEIQLKIIIYNNYIIEYVMFKKILLVETNVF